VLRVGKAIQHLLKGVWNDALFGVVYCLCVSVARVLMRVVRYEPDSDACRNCSFLCLTPVTLKMVRREVRLVQGLMHEETGTDLSINNTFVSTII
jgi:hypothetical protein